MTTLCLELAAAWAEKASRAAATLTHAALAPALFKPEYVAELQAEFDKARAWSRYWAAVGSA